MLWMRLARRSFTIRKLTPPRSWRGALNRSAQGPRPHRSIMVMSTRLSVRLPPALADQPPFRILQEGGAIELGRQLPQPDMRFVTAPAAGHGEHVPTAQIAETDGVAWAGSLALAHGSADADRRPPCLQRAAPIVAVAAGPSAS